MIIQHIQYTLTATDGDDIELLYSATVDGNVKIDVTGSTLTITPELDFNGDIVVDVTVSDGVLTDTNNFTLSVFQCQRCSCINRYTRSEH